jgi:hypothetical protein
MSARAFLAAAGVTFAIAIAACQSSGPYGTPAQAALATGIAVAGAAASRAAGGCVAECIAGSVCNTKTGLCERPEPHPAPVAAPAVASGGRPAPVVSTRAPYPPGHEYSVPPASNPACDPAAASSSREAPDAGPIACEMDASAP